MSAPSSRSARLLVVADPDDPASAVAGALTSAGFRVRTARSAAEGVEEARTGFDVALVAMRLRDGEGAALGPRLREHSVDAEVILMAPDASLEAALAAMRRGSCSF